MKNLLILTATVIGLMSCNKAGETTAESVNDSTQESSISTTTVYLQPLGNYSHEEAEKLKTDIEKHEEDFGSVCIKDIKILPNKPLTDDLMNDTKTRYRADKIIETLKKQLHGHSTVIGLIHKDISVSHDGKKDWGVIGCAFRGSHSCVISTYRMKNNLDFWKAAAHEFCHAFYGVGHCPKDNQHCILQDAKGKYTFDRSPGLCEYCKSQL